MMITNTLWVDGKCHTPTSIISCALITAGPKKQANVNPLTPKTNTWKIKYFSLNET